MGQLFLPIFMLGTTYLKQVTDTSNIFIAEVAPVFDTISETVVVEFLSDEYEIDYENYGYIYKTQNKDGVIIYLEYFPKNNTVKVYDEYEKMGGAAVRARTYYLHTEEEIQE